MQTPNGGFPPGPGGFVSRTLSGYDPWQKKGGSPGNFFGLQTLLVDGSKVVTMRYFRSLAKRDWEKYLPGMVEELKAEGIYEQELDRAAQEVSKELARIVSGGGQVQAAKEIVLKEYIFLEPETEEE
jgi:hypothetical protein